MYMCFISYHLSFRIQNISTKLVLPNGIIHIVVVLELTNPSGPRRAGYFQESFLPHFQQPELPALHACVPPGLGGKEPRGVLPLLPRVCDDAVHPAELRYIQSSYTSNASQHRSRFLSAGQPALYPFLDFKNNLELAVIIVLVSSLLIPVIHLSLCFLSGKINNLSANTETNLKDKQK